MNLTDFIFASLVLILTPGPDVYFVITQSISGGKLSGIYTALGLACGNLVHTLIVSLGIAALITSNPIAFDTIKYLGFLYLLYLSYDAYRNREQKVFNLSKHEQPSSKLFIKGMMMNVLNPKVSLFFISFFPLFLNKNTENKGMQLFIMGMIFIVLVSVCFSAIAMLANFLSRFLSGFKNIDKKINILKSLIFLVLALLVVILPK